MTKEHKILHKIKDLHSNSKEFKKDFDKDRESAIEKHLGPDAVKDLKNSFGKDVLKKSSSMTKAKDGKVSKASMDSVAGGKGKRTTIRAGKSHDTLESQKSLETNISGEVGGNASIVQNIDPSQVSDTIMSRAKEK